MISFIMWKCVVRDESKIIGAPYAELQASNRYTVCVCVSNLNGQSVREVPSTPYPNFMLLNAIAANAICGTYFLLHLIKIPVQLIFDKEYQTSGNISSPQRHQTNTNFNVTARKWIGTALEHLQKELVSSSICRPKITRQTLGSQRHF